MGRPLPILGQSDPGGASSAGVTPFSARRPIRRETDRRITAAGVALALLFVAGSVVAIVAGRDPWMALHLLLTGGTGVAIGAVMPFFTAALAAAPPARPLLRSGVVIGLAAGALTIVLAVPAAHRSASLLGAGVYLVSLVGLAVVTVAPLRQALGQRRWPVIVAYLAGIGFILLGVTLVTGLLHDFAPVTDRWSQLKPVHAWLNLVGFVGLTIAGTFIHLVPTVLGARIVEGRMAWLVVVGLTTGVALVAAGFVLASDIVARAGAIVAIGGAIGVPAYVVIAVRQPTRGRWTTDPGWHRFTTWSLLASAAWFAIGVGAASALVLVHGASPAGWSLAIVGMPLAVGCVVQAMLGAAAHMIPTIGPGSGPARARARRILGHGAAVRVASLDTGVAMLAIGIPLAQPVLVSIGGFITALAIVTTLGLVLASVLTRPTTVAQR